ncbi:MAG TPA: histidine phosphatase family protein [Roseateles sp.]|nr:histidine phosphatase family protein [Roseateles sp.]
MDLLLWRHADAAPARVGEDDDERALTAKGERQARRMARWLAAALPADARILVSPARRAQQTARALGRPFDTCVALAAEADAEDLLAAAGWPMAARSVLVVGHQPMLGEAAALLLAGQRRPWAIKKGALWWLRGSAIDPVDLLAVRSPDKL